ncbi:hypothetical protein [Limosilactobacillus sp.]|uniref:hypothetical protein n=1 Tax=Limosilactobacillus sp. TaxID=2773925 RepID=UPI003F01E1AB
MPQQDRSVEVAGDTFKHLETTKTIVMRFRNSDGTSYATPTVGHTYVAKVANKSGYIGDYPVTLSGSQVSISTADLTKLVPDDYSLEVWESYTDNEGKLQTTIYPSPGTRVYFQIESNIADTAGELIKQINIQDVVNGAVIAAGKNVVVDSTVTLAPGSQASVTETYKDGKNHFNFSIPRGDPGKDGNDGISPTIKVGKVTTGTPDQSVSFTNSGDEHNAVFDVVIPQGEKGKKGDTPTFEPGTVTKLAADATPTVTLTKTTTGYKINLGIPQGKDGYTPKRGTDYWTTDDQSTISSWITSAVKSSIDSMTQDVLAKTKQYVDDDILNGKW